MKKEKQRQPVIHKFLRGDYMTAIRCWIYTDSEKKNKVLYSELSKEEQEKISIALNVQAMKQAGYERTA